jgi:hypothetical protein
MVEPKRFNRGKHSYTKWGSHFKEVRVPGKKKEKESEAHPVQISIDLDFQTALGVYSNLTMVHRSKEEVILDFVFLAPGQKKGKVRSRVIVPLKSVGQLTKLLQNAAEEIKKSEEEDQ